MFEDWSRFCGGKVAVFRDMVFARPKGTRPLNWKGRQDEAEAESEDAVRRRVEVAERSAAALRVVEPTAAAKHAERALFRSFRVFHHPFVQTFLIIIAAIPVCAPFPYIAAHIEKAQFIGKFQAYRLGFVVAVLVVPAHFVYHIAA